MTKNKKTNKIILEVIRVKRLDNSKNGNPNWQITTYNPFPDLKDYFRWKTPSDCGWVYGIVFPNLKGKKVEIEWHFTPKGQVVLDNIVAICGRSGLRFNPQG